MIVFVCECVQMCVCVRSGMCNYMWVWVYLWICMCVSMNTCVNMCVCLSVCVWACVFLSECMHVYVMEGPGMTIHPAHRSASALAAMPFISAGWPATCGSQSWLSLGWHAKPAFYKLCDLMQVTDPLPPSVPWAVKGRSHYCTESVRGRSKACPVGALRVHPLPSRWDSPLWQFCVRGWGEAGTRQAQAGTGVRKRTAAANAAPTPDSSTRRLCESPGHNDWAANTTHGCHSRSFSHSTRGEGDRLLSLTWQEAGDCDGDVCGEQVWSTVEEPLWALTLGYGCCVPQSPFSQAPGLSKARTRRSEVWCETAGPSHGLLSHTDEARAPRLPREMNARVCADPTISEARCRALWYRNLSFTFTLCFPSYKQQFGAATDSFCSAHSLHPPALAHRQKVTDFILASFLWPWN